MAAASSAILGSCPRLAGWLMLATLPATATGIGLVVAGVALHHDP